MLERFQKRTKQDVDAARKNVLAATAELARVRASEGLAAGQDTGAAFDANVNRRRMSPTPPRTVPVRLRASRLAWALVKLPRMFAAISPCDGYQIC